jgi:hypothetical protein
MGRIGIKGVVGPAWQTDITILKIKAASITTRGSNSVQSLSEVFAVCDDLNEDVILTADTVKRLSALNNCDDERLHVNHATRESCEERNDAVVNVDDVDTIAVSNDANNHKVSNRDVEVVKIVSDVIGNNETNIVAIEVNVASDVNADNVVSTPVCDKSDKDVSGSDVTFDTDIDGVETDADTVCDTTDKVEFDCGSCDVNVEIRSGGTEITLNEVTKEQRDDSVAYYCDSGQSCIRNDVLYRDNEVRGNKVKQKVRESCISCFMCRSRDRDKDREKRLGFTSNGSIEPYQSYGDYLQEVNTLFDCDGIRSYCSRFDVTCYIPFDGGTCCTNASGERFHVR